MNVRRVLGFVAVAGMLVIAAPAERANAAPLGSPGLAAALQNEGKLSTEVRWRHHRGWHRHHWRHW